MTVEVVQNSKIINFETNNAEEAIRELRWRKLFEGNVKPGDITILLRSCA